MKHKFRREVTDVMPVLKNGPEFPAKIAPQHDEQRHE